MFESGRFILTIVLFIVAVVCTWHAATRYEKAEGWQGKVWAVVGTFAFNGVVLFLLVEVTLSPLP